MRYTAYYAMDEKSYPNLFKAFFDIAPPRPVRILYENHEISFGREHIWNIYICEEEGDSFNIFFVLRQIRTSISFLKKLIQNNELALVDFYKMRTTEHKYTGECEDEDVDG
jgi:hypothetical protein